jgi:hypothetical protein
MKLFFTLVFFQSALFSWSQPYSHSDTSLWDSPLSSKQVLRAGVKQVVVKSIGWCTVECSTPWYDTLTTCYNYDAYGYPVSLSRQDCRGTNEFISENIYSDGLLVRSLLRQKKYLYKIYNQSFNSGHMLDSCSWLTNGQCDGATAYAYDSLLRIQKTNYYHPSHGTSLSLQKEVEEFYNAGNMPVRSICTFHYGADWQKKVESFTIHYRRSFRVHKVITRNEARKKVNVIKTYYKGNFKRKIKVIPKHAEYHVSKDIQKISRKNGQIIYRKYKFYWLHGCIPYRKFIEQSVYDGSSGLLIRKVYLIRRPRTRHHGPKGDRLVEFSYLK